MDDFLYNLRRETDKRNRRQGGQQNYRGPDRRGPKDQQRRNYNRRNEASEQISELLPEIKTLLTTMSDNQAQLLESEQKKMAALESIAESLRIMSGNNQPVKAVEEVEIPEAPEAIETVEASQPVSEAVTMETVEETPETSEEAAVEKKADEAPKCSTREEIRKIALSLREEGKTYKEIAQYLDDEKIPTFSGKGGWHAPTIHKLCK